jgi:hypothetical protein
MVNSEMPLRLNARNPVFIVLLSTLAFFALDNLVFRSGLYMRVIPPVTTSTKLFSTVVAEERRTPSGKTDVLLTGNSRMEFAFSKGAFAKRFPQSPLDPIVAAVPGSDLKWWYYILKALDPHQNRYACIVLSLDDFRVEPSVQDPENWYYTAQSLVPVIGFAEMPGFIGTFTDDAVRALVWRRMIFSSRGAGMELFLPVWQRITDRVLKRGRPKVSIEDGPPQSVESLVISNDTGGVLSYPAHFDAFMKRESDAEFIRPSEAEAERLTNRNAIFQQTWLRRIVQLYRASTTKLMILQMPRWPFMLPAKRPTATSPDLRAELAGLPNVAVLSEGDFAELETPRYFFDLLHLNTTGRTKFTETLGMRIETLAIKFSASR